VNFSNSLRELGPALYVLNAGDLTSIMSGNQLKAYKYADDTYIVVPAVNIYSCEAELEHIEKWAARNKLKINLKKSLDIIFMESR